MRFKWRRDHSGVWKDDINLRLIRDTKEHPPLLGWVRYEKSNWVAVHNIAAGHVESEKFSAMLPAMRWVRHHALIRVLAGEI